MKRNSSVTAVTFGVTGLKFVLALLISGCTAPEPVEVPSDDKADWLHYLESLGIPDIGEEAAK